MSSVQSPLTIVLIGCYTVQSPLTIVLVGRYTVQSPLPTIHNCSNSCWTRECTICDLVLGTQSIPKHRSCHSAFMRLMDFLQERIIYCQTSTPYSILDWSYCSLGVLCFRNHFDKFTDLFRKWHLQRYWENVLGLHWHLWSYIVLLVLCSSQILQVYTGRSRGVSKTLK